MTPMHLGNVYSAVVVGASVERLLSSGVRAERGQGTLPRLLGYLSLLHSVKRPMEGLEYANVETD